MLTEALGNKTDIKQSIKRYLSLSETHAALTERRANYGRDFYRRHSLVGGMVANDEAYNSAVRPDTAVIRILSEEAILTRMIERVELRKRKFDEYLSEIDREELEAAVESEEVAPIELEAYEFITEIEYYLTSHAMERVKKRNEKLMALSTASMHEEMNVTNQLGLFGKFNKQQTKQVDNLLSELMSYENELFEKLGELFA